MCCDGEKKKQSSHHIFVFCCPFVLILLPVSQCSSTFQRLKYWSLTLATRAPFLTVHVAQYRTLAVNASSALPPPTPSKPTLDLQLSPHGFVFGACHRLHLSVPLLLNGVDDTFQAMFFLTWSTDKKDRLYSPRSSKLANILMHLGKGGLNVTTHHDTVFSHYVPRPIPNCSALV